MIKFGVINSTKFIEGKHVKLREILKSNKWYNVSFLPTVCKLKQQMLVRNTNPQYDVKGFTLTCFGANC